MTTQHRPIVSREQQPVTAAQLASKLITTLQEHRLDLEVAWRAVNNRHRTLAEDIRRVVGADNAQVESLYFSPKETRDELEKEVAMIKHEWSRLDERE